MCVCCALGTIEKVVDMEDEALQAENKVVFQDRPGTVS